MADENDYVFYVDSGTTQPFGPVSKENLDITRLVFDFTCWLVDADDGTTEPISSVGFPAIGLASQAGYPPWQVDYPFSDNTTPVVIEDTYPLTIQSVTIAAGATEVEVLVSAGTPGVEYVVSVVASAATTRRRKQVDCLVSVEAPLNPDLLAASTPDPTAGAPLIVSGDTTLPLGFDGRVYVENGSSAPITITLPITPNQAQRVAPVDINGNANTYPITYAGAPGDNIYSSPTFVSDVNFDDLIFEWTGDHWIVLSSRYTFLG